jgi:hypothetical protein
MFVHRIHTILFQILKPVWQPFTAVKVQQNTVDNQPYTDYSSHSSKHPPVWQTAPVWRCHTYSSCGLWSTPLLLISLQSCWKLNIYIYLPFTLKSNSRRYNIHVRGILVSAIRLNISSDMINCILLVLLLGFLVSRQLLSLTMNQGCLGSGASVHKVFYLFRAIKCI